MRTLSILCGFSALSSFPSAPHLDSLMKPRRQRAYGESARALLTQTFLRASVLLLFVWLSFALPMSLLAQSIQGSVLGTVKDATGASVPGAKVILTNTDEGTTRVAAANSVGNFEFVDAKAGHYSLRASHAGFEKWATSDVVLAARQQFRVDPVLKPGDVQQEVTVSAASIPAIDTESASVSGTYNAADVLSLPVNTRASASGTSALNIVGTLPGVQADHGQFSLQGALPFQTEVSIDGITAQNATNNQPIANAFPSSESISEIRADGVLNNAEFGQPGEITVITKGGTNSIHGAIFWYHQNAAFDAIPYTFPITIRKPKLVANTFGGSFGGPVVIPHFYDGHNRTFVFGAYEGWRHPSQATYGYKVPSTLMKQGDFSRYTSTSTPFTGLTNPFTGGSYGTKLPTINAASAKLLSLYPDPNVGDPAAYSDDSVANYIVNKDSSGSSNQFDIRGDQYFGSNQKFLLWGRFTYKNFPTNSPEPLLVPSAQNTNNARVLKISANYSITPALVNEFGFGFTFSTTGQSNSFNGTAFTQGLGLTGLQNLFYNGIPELDFSNISSLNADRLSSLTQSKTFVYTDNLNWVKGQHSMRFGLDVTTVEAVTPLGFNGSDNYGTFQFNTSNSAGLFTGVDFADFLLGTPYQTFYDVVQADNDGKSTHYAAYAQDQWKATPDLTITYGLRYEIQPPYSDVHGDIGNFDPTYAKSGAAIYPDGAASLLATSFLASANACSPLGSTSGGATLSGAPCMPVLTNSQAGYPAGLKHYPHARFLPRVGFAYRPFHDDKTVVSAGFGLYNVTLLGSNFYSLTGTLQAQTTQYTNGLNTTTRTPNYRWPAIYAGAGNGGCTTCYGQNYFGTANSTNWKDPYTEQFALSVEHSLSHAYAIRASYIGSETHQLVWAPDENTLPFSNTVSAANQPLSARLFPNWGRINTRATGANENYQSAQVDVSRRLQGGLQFESTYTYSRALADNQGPANNSGFAGESGGARATSILDRNADFGNVYGTRRNRWNNTMVYALPFGAGQAFANTNSRLANLFLGGWQLSNIFLWQSGPFESPYFPSGQGDPSGTGSGLNGTNTGFDPGHRNQAPDKVAGAAITPANRTRMNWANTAAFTCPGLPTWKPGTACTTGSGKGAAPLPIGRFGNAGVGTIVGPGTVTLSTGLAKSVAITERMHLRLEGTFTNILNHTNLGDPNVNISSPSFGLISKTIGSDNGGARTGQVSARIDF